MDGGLVYSVEHSRGHAVIVFWDGVLRLGSGGVWETDFERVL